MSDELPAWKVTLAGVIRLFLSSVGDEEAWLDSGKNCGEGLRNDLSIDSGSPLTRGSLLF